MDWTKKMEKKERDRIVRAIQKGNENYKNVY